MTSFNTIWSHQNLSLIQLAIDCNQSKKPENNKKSHLLPKLILLNNK